MKILKIEGKDLREEQKREIDAFCLNSNWGSIHQTWEWGEFQMEHPGRKKFWVVLVYEENLVAMAVLVRSELPFGKMALICPRGPILRELNKVFFDGVVRGCRELAESENAVYVRFEWPFEKGRVSGVEDFMVGSDFEMVEKWMSGLRNAHAHHQPECSLVVDISVDEEEILKQMKQKGRYNIRLAKKKEVQVRTGKNSDDIKAFFELVRTTTERNHFSGHGEKYYKNMLGKLGKNAVLYLAEFEGEVIAGIIVTFFGEEAIYYYGASGNEHRNLMAPYLLQWEAMLDAKKRGCKVYDFFGIAPSDDRKHPWRKITEFKKKFGGVEVHYIPAREMVIQGLWYWIMLMAKRMRGILRGGR